MSEIWLRNNRRMLWLSMIPPFVVAAIGLFFAFRLGPISAEWMVWLGRLILLFGVLLLAAVAWQWRVPRLGYEHGEILVHLTGERPDRVPIRFVECFFLGKGAGQIPGKGGHELPLRNLIVRLSDRAGEFRDRKVKATLGRWEDGYITIHGAWCEPLTLDLVNRLNARLAEVQKAIHQEEGQECP